MTSAFDNVEDVYKRQTLEGAWVGIEFDQPTKVNHIVIEQATPDAVSYTHLDVYKRQPLVSAVGLLHRLPLPSA